MSYEPEDNWKNHTDGMTRRAFDAKAQGVEDPVYYPEFEHVVGPGTIAISERAYIGPGPEAERNDAPDRLFRR